MYQMFLDDTMRKPEGHFVAFLKSHVCRGRDLHTHACGKEWAPVHGKGAAPHAMVASYTTPVGDSGSCLPNFHFPSLDDSTLTYSE